MSLGSQPEVIALPQCTPHHQRKHWVKRMLDTLLNTVGGLAGKALAWQQQQVGHPRAEITLDGALLSALSPRLMSLTLTDYRGFTADTLTLELDDTDGKLALPPRGAKLSIALGWRDELLTHKGVFVVDEVQHQGPPDKLTISASSADFRAEFNVKREQSWHDITVGKVVQAIAARYSLVPAISQALIDIEIDHADQHDESDISFLTRMAEMLGAVATIKAGRLLFIIPGQGLSASGQPLPAVELTRQDGDGHSFTIADRDAYTGVTAHWLDLKQGKKQITTVSGAKQGDYLAGTAGNVHVMRTTYRSEKNAKRAAAAKWDELRRGAAQFSITLAKGRADLYPELPVILRGFKPEIDSAHWVIVEVGHQLGGGGYTTELKLELKSHENDAGEI
ncbi:MAG: phage late control D family protein [Aeromonas sp.]